VLKKCREVTVVATHHLKHVSPTSFDVTALVVPWILCSFGLFSSSLGNQQHVVLQQFIQQLKKLCDVEIDGMWELRCSI
jgi:hypothetical protein